MVPSSFNLEWSSQWNEVDRLDRDGQMMVCKAYGQNPCWEFPTLDKLIMAHSFAGPEIHLGPDQEQCKMFTDLL